MADGGNFLADANGLQRFDRLRTRVTEAPISPMPEQPRKPAG
jgi:hypothetical protein